MKRLQEGLDKSKTTRLQFHKQLSTNIKGFVGTNFMRDIMRSEIICEYDFAQEPTYWICYKKVYLMFFTSNDNTKFTLHHSSSVKSLNELGNVNMSIMRDEIVRNVGGHIHNLQIHNEKKYHKMLAPLLLEEL